MITAHTNKLPNRFEDIDSIEVKTSDIVNALKRNNQRSAHLERGKAVIRVLTPVEGDTSAEEYTDKPGHRYPDRGQNPIHLDPALFVEDKAIVTYPLLQATREDAEAELDNPSEELIYERHVNAIKIWEDSVRDAVVEEIELNGTVEINQIDETE